MLGMVNALYLPGATRTMRLSFMPQRFSEKRNSSMVLKWGESPPMFLTPPMGPSHTMNSVNIVSL